MARISGVDLPNEKRVEIALCYIFGIGRTLSNKILENCAIDPNTRVKNLNDEDVSKIRDTIENGGYTVEGDLRREIAMNIKRLTEIGCYRGRRHRMGARTRKGPKRTMAGKKK
jgi:small subunit ribosomal protein S13